MMGTVLGVTLSEKAFLRGLSEVRWPARLQVLAANPPLLLDGAHNIEAACVLRRALDELPGGRQCGLVAGFLSDKDAAGILRELQGCVGACWLVPLSTERAMPGADMLAAARSAGLDASLHPLDEALEAAADWARRNHGMVCAAGSLYLAGEILARHQAGGLPWGRQPDMDQPPTRSNSD